MKFNFQKVLPKARRFTNDYCDCQFKIKDRQSREVMHSLKAAGYKVEGEINTENNTTFGMVKGNEHIIVTDSGKYPFYLGDTTIRIGTMTQRYDAPINLR